MRLDALTRVAGRNAQRRFAGEWRDFIRIPVTEALVARADALAWEHGLRGYDAVQLASALAWQDAIGQPAVFTTFDQTLTNAAEASGMEAWPGSARARSRS